MTKEFEKKFAEYVGAKYCIFVNSCTAALNLSLQYLRRQQKIKSVLVPSLTFVATVSEVLHNGLKPVFGDVDDDYCLDGWHYHKGFDAAIPVHATGNKADTGVYYEPVIEDSAHLIERDQCKYTQNTVCFSFYATKNLAVGEGGMIATNDPDLYVWAYQARHHGISKGGWDRYDRGGWRYDIDFLGWKANQSDIQAALGIVQLGKLDKMNQMRQEIVDLYNKELGYKNRGLHIYPILVDNRDKFMEFMKLAGIQCSVHFIPVHTLKAFKKYKKQCLPKTEYFGERLVSLPLYPGMTKKQVLKVCEEVKRTKWLLKPGVPV